MFVSVTVAFGSNHRWNIWGFCVPEASPWYQRKAWRSVSGPAPSPMGVSVSFPLTLRDARVPGSRLVVQRHWALRGPSSWTTRLWKGFCPVAVRNFARVAIHDNCALVSGCWLDLGSASCPLLTMGEHQPQAQRVAGPWRCLRPGAGGQREKAQPKPAESLPRALGGGPCAGCVRLWRGVPRGMCLWASLHALSLKLPQLTPSRPLGALASVPQHCFGASSPCRTPCAQTCHTALGLHPTTVPCVPPVPPNPAAVGHCVPSSSAWATETLQLPTKFNKYLYASSYLVGSGKNWKKHLRKNTFLLRKLAVWVYKINLSVLWIALSRITIPTIELLLRRHKFWRSCTNNKIWLLETRRNVVWKIRHSGAPKQSGSDTESDW